MNASQPLAPRETHLHSSHRSIPDSDVVSSDNGIAAGDHGGRGFPKEPCVDSKAWVTRGGFPLLALCDRSATLRPRGWEERAQPGWRCGVQLSSQPEFSSLTPTAAGAVGRNRAA